MLNSTSILSTNKYKYLYNVYDQIKNSGKDILTKNVC